MRTLLTTTALVALFSMGAVAQEANQPAAGNQAGSQAVTTDSHLLTQGFNMRDTDGLASRLLGFPVYTSAANDAEQLGEINDLVIGQDGQIAAVVLGVGGFLGMGEKNVAIEYNQLQWTVAEDNTERLVLETNRDVLAAAPEVQLIDDRAVMDTAQAPAAGQPVDQQPVDETQTGAIGQPGAAPMAPGAVTMDRLNRDGLVDFDESALTAEDLTGVNVYGPGDEHIGTIGDFVLGEDDRIDAVIIDFGGFLGIGTKQVAVGYENLDFYADPNGDVFLVMNLTREQMEQAPEFNRDTYAQERDSQRLVLEGSAAAASN